MALMESAFLSKVGTSLATGIAKKAGAELARKLRTSEREKALERCARTAVEALVEEGFLGGTDIPRDHLEGVLGQFTEDESVHGVLAEAIREGRLAEGESPGSGRASRRPTRWRPFPASTQSAASPPSSPPSWTRRTRRPPSRA